MKHHALSVATSELVAAIEWYQGRSLSAAEAFVAEYERAVSEIKAHPQRYPRAEFIESSRDIRQFLMRRFPYIVYYEIAADEVLVLAISHGARDRATG